MLYCIYDTHDRNGMREEPPRQLAEYLPEISVISYIDRNVGVCSALLQKWEDAARHWKTSLHTFPANATCS